MTSLITILPLSLSLLGVSNSSTDVTYAGAESDAPLRFVLIETPINTTPNLGNVAPTVDGKGSDNGSKADTDNGSKPQDEATPLPRPGLPEPILGDLTFDSAIDYDDLIELILHWGQCPALIDVSCNADLNGDDFVNAQDLSMFMRLLNQFQANENENS